MILYYIVNKQEKCSNSKLTSSLSLSFSACTITVLPTHMYNHSPTNTYVQSQSYQHICTLTVLPTHMYNLSPTNIYVQSQSYQHISTITVLPTYMYNHSPTNILCTILNMIYMTQQNSMISAAHSISKDNNPKLVQY